MPLISIYAMGFILFVAGLGAFGTALAYAWRPTEQKLALMRPLSLAGIFSAVCSTAGGAATILKGAAATSEWRGSLIFGGMAEAVVPLFVAFAFLSVSWLLVAIGMRRHQV